MSLIEDFREESDALYAFVSSLTEEQWRAPTIFWGWATFDEILHLFYVDRFALTSIADPTKFGEMRDAYRSAIVQGAEMSELSRFEFGDLSKAQLLDRWRGQYLELCAQATVHPLEHRVAWFGPDMGVGSMMAARQMEVWAHGQDIYDLFRVKRQPAARLRNICDIGVRTFGWTFANRKLPRPGPAPKVKLAAPGGGEWIWNSAETQCLSGPAEDFALIVTQRRNVRDTNITCEGRSAVDWMALAQCFAGPPADPPEPGIRV
jgi:uncharacterized protein (TIGR03084 family)